MMDKSKIFSIILLCIAPFALSVAIGTQVSETYGDFFAAIITVFIFLLLITSFFVIYKLAKKKKEIEKKVDEYFENKEK